MMGKDRSVKQQLNETVRRQRAEPPVRQGPVAPAPQPSPLALQRAIADPRAAPPCDILALQRLAGNRAVTRLIQAKLTVGGPTGRLRSRRSAVIQPSTFNPQSGFEAGPDVENRLAASRGSGSPLPDDVRATMEPRFGADFGGVRVHTGGEADQLNRQLSAQAFTYGQDVYMRAGKYAPGTPAGNRLLAHELAHTIQQTGMQAARSIARAAETVQRNGDPPKSLTEHPLLEQARQDPDEGVDEVQLDVTVPPVARAILQPVLQGRDRFDIESDPSSIIRPIYASYWNYASANWQYVASANAGPAPVLAGTQTRGMCQTFSLVFEALFNILNRTLGAQFFDVSTDNSLSEAIFYTGPGLTLIGNTGCRGNIYLETQDGGQTVAMGYANVNRYFYTYHWRPKINGIIFDPLFQVNPAAIPVTRVTFVPNTARTTFTDGTGLVCAARSAAPPQPSFTSNYILINNRAVFEANRQAVIDLYNLISAGWRERKRATGKWFPSSEINRRCRALVATLGDLNVFEMAAGCYNGGEVAAHQRFKPMLDEVRKRARQ